jgi:hypothetical protein
MRQKLLMLHLIKESTDNLKFIIDLHIPEICECIEWRESWCYKNDEGDDAHVQDGPGQH